MSILEILKNGEDEDTVAKYTIPAPAPTFQQFIIPGNLESTRGSMRRRKELIHDIVMLIVVIKQF